MRKGESTKYKITNAGVCSILNLEPTPTNISKISYLRKLGLPNSSCESEVYSWYVDYVTGEFEESPTKNVGLNVDLGEPKCIYNVMDQKEIVGQIMSILDQNEKELIRMRYFENLTLSEIANEKSVSVELIRRRLNKIFKKIRRNCGKYGDITSFGTIYVSNGTELFDNFTYGLVKDNWKITHYNGLLKRHTERKKRRIESQIVLWEDVGKVYNPNNDDFLQRIIKSIKNAKEKLLQLN